MTIDRAGDLREGTLFQETPRASGDPAVSPDGTQTRGRDPRSRRAAEARGLVDVRAR
jgi:hypothetical protein